MLEELKVRVCDANKMLKSEGLVKLTWGNVSAIDREKMLVVIKPSGVSYDELTPEKMVVVDMEGNVVEGDLNPSSDTPTHIALYESFDEIGAIVHTHSRYATVWAQAGLDIIAYGTTHADYFYGDIPCTVPMTKEQIEVEYEKNTGYIIADTLVRRAIPCMSVPACLVAQHGPFCWADTPEKAVENAVVLEEIATMAIYNTNFQFGLTRISEALLDKHYYRKHGDEAYYGQGIDLKEKEKSNPESDTLEIMPSKHTIELENISKISEVSRPVINKPPQKEEEAFNFGNAPEAEEPSSGGDDMSGSGPLDFTF